MKTDLRGTPWLLLVLVISILLLIGVVYAQAGDETFYDAQGRRAGSAQTDNSGSTTFYDAQGRRAGSSRTDSDGTTTFYNAQGQRAGSATRNSNGPNQRSR